MSRLRSGADVVLEVLQAEQVRPEVGDAVRAALAAARPAVLHVQVAAPPTG